MTATTPTTTTVTPPRSYTRSFTGRQNFLTTLHSEFIKLRTLRSTWISSILTLLITGGLGAVVSITAAHSEYLGRGATWHYLVAGTTFGQIVVAVLGSLVITGEYSTGQIRSTLAAVPSRPRVFWAKALAIGLWSFLMGVLSILIGWIMAVPFVDSTNAGSLFDPQFLSYLWGTGFAFLGISWMALGFGFLLRSTAGSITTISVLLFVINIPLSIAAGFWKWADSAQHFTLAMVAPAIVDPLEVSTNWGGSGPITHLEAVAVFAAWCLVPLFAGWFVFSKRDA